MPRQPQSDSAESIAINQLIDEDDAALKAVAQQLGPPHGAVKQSARDEVRRWGQLDPRVDRDMMPQQLMQTGLPPEQAQELAILQEYPELLPLYTQPTGDPQMADMLTRFAEMPYRWSLLEGIDDPEERVKKAESLDAAHQKDLMDRQRLASQIAPSITSALSGVRGLLQKPAPAPAGMPSMPMPDVMGG